MGKIGCAASRIQNIIYITGGYHVYADKSEKSSNKMHRFDVDRNKYLPDGPNIPIATDDHVQLVWRDSLLILITGWSDVTNIPDVQIFDPKTETWSSGTSIPNNNAYKSFGAFGIIIKDTIYYFGGASSGGFIIQPWLRKGVINPANPNEITWSFSAPDHNIAQYRGTAISIQNRPHWLGGATTTYNYDGLAYQGGEGVSPTRYDYTWSGSAWIKNFNYLLPMDLRGIAKLNDSTAYIAGGMASVQRVSSVIYKLSWGNRSATVSSIQPSKILGYPNPFTNLIYIGPSNDSRYIALINAVGQTIPISLNTQNQIDTRNVPSGCYHLFIKDKNGSSFIQVIKL